MAALAMNSPLLARTVSGVVLRCSFSLLLLLASSTMTTTAEFTAPLYRNTTSTNQAQIFGSLVPYNDSLTVSFFGPYPDVTLTKFTQDGLHLAEKVVLTNVKAYAQLIPVAERGEMYLIFTNASSTSSPNIILSRIDLDTLQVTRTEVVSTGMKCGGAFLSNDKSTIFFAYERERYMQSYSLSSWTLDPERHFLQGDYSIRPYVATGPAMNGVAGYDSDTLVYMEVNQDGGCKSACQRMALVDYGSSNWTVVSATQYLFVSLGYLKDYSGTVTSLVRSTVGPNSTLALQTFDPFTFTPLQIYQTGVPGVAVQRYAQYNTSLFVSTSYLDVVQLVQLDLTADFSCLGTLPIPLLTYAPGSLAPTSTRLFTDVIDRSNSTFLLQELLEVNYDNKLDSSSCSS